MTMAAGIKDDFYERLRGDYYACRERDGNVHASFVYRFLAAREPSKNARRGALARERAAMIDAVGGADALSPEQARRVAEIDRQIAAENERACEVFFENHGYPVSRTGSSQKRGSKRDKALGMIDAFCRERGLCLGEKGEESERAGDGRAPHPTSAASVDPRDAESLYAAVAHDSARRRLFAPLDVDARTGTALLIVGVDWLRAGIAREVLTRFAATAPGLSDDERARLRDILGGAAGAGDEADGRAVARACATGLVPWSLFAVTEPEEYIPEEVSYIQANTNFLFSVNYNEGAASVFWEYAPAKSRYDVARAERLSYFVRAENGVAPDPCPASCTALFQPAAAFDEDAYARDMADLDASLKRFSS